LNVEGYGKDEGTCWGVVTCVDETWVKAPYVAVTKETAAPCEEKEE